MAALRCPAPPSKLIALCGALHPPVFVRYARQKQMRFYPIGNKVSGTKPRYKDTGAFQRKIIEMEIVPMKNFKLSDYITLKSAGLIVGGSLLFSAAMNLLIVPMQLYSGGFLGIAQLFRQLLLTLGVNVENIDVAGIVYFIMNVPLFLLSFKPLASPSS